MRAGQVGRSLPRLEARAKVTGRAEYVHNLRLPGMLTGKIFRSTVAHGRIRRIDISAARALPGVHRVITAQDILAILPNPYYGPAFHDQPILAVDKVHHVGEPVAVVLAADPHVAEEAVALIVAEYDELPAVFDEIEAVTSKAVVHDVLKPAGTFADLKHLEGRRGTNVALDYHLRRGDAERALGEADHVFEHTFRTQQVMHTPLEPFVSAADPGDNAVTIHTASQGPSFVRIEIARLLGWPENRVRVKVPYLGGGFGAKLYIKLEALVVALALIARRPVKIALTMEEQFYTITKHAATLRIKSGVSKDGRITARRCEIWWNGGAFADVGPRVTQKSGFSAAGPYDIDHLHLDSYALYTNLPPAGALRGFGIPQLCWAYESHTDMVARAMKIDPVEFRRRNILREGRPQATGTLVHDTPLDRILERLAVRTVDMGQGSDTAMAQIAGEVLNVPAESVTIVHPDTDVTPYDMGTLGSRSLYHMGHAVKRAAEDAAAKLRAMAQELGLPEGANVPVAELFRRKYGMQAGNVIGVGSFVPSYTPPEHGTGLTTNVTPFWMAAGAGVELEVDTETGHVRLTRLVNVADVGKPINPRIVETQLSGGSIMQLGFTMFERMDFEAGQVTNASLADYKIPGLHDLPPVIENEAVDNEQHDGPYGAKGVGETATFAVSPAVANAIEDAVGVRLTSLPLTPEAVFRALRAAQGKPLGEE